MERPFLTARWQNLLMLNYRCDPELLRSRVPAGVELDTFEGETYVSMVGFLFQDTRIRGISVPPWMRTFEEVNLRFYVRRKVGDEVRRGVVFVRELVPHRLTAWIARMLYGEPYSAVPMAHRVSTGESTYSWRLAGNAFSLSGTVQGPAQPLGEGSMEEFITEHYWGYTARGPRQTDEYRVAHPRWDVWRCDIASFTGEKTALYGPEFEATLSAEPVSALLAVGSAVEVFPGSRIGA